MTEEDDRKFKRLLRKAITSVNCYQRIYSPLFYEAAEEDVAAVRECALEMTGEDWYSDEVSIALDLSDILHVAKRQHEEAEQLAAGH